MDLVLVLEYLLILLRLQHLPYSVVGYHQDRHLQQLQLGSDVGPVQQMQLAVLEALVDLFPLHV